MVQNLFFFLKLKNFLKTKKIMVWQTIASWTKTAWNWLVQGGRLLNDAVNVYQAVEDIYFKGQPPPTPILPEYDRDKLDQLYNGRQPITESECMSIFGKQFQTMSDQQPPEWLGKCCLDEPRIYCKCFNQIKTTHTLLLSCPYLMEKKFDATCHHLNNATQNTNIGFHDQLYSSSIANRYILFIFITLFLVIFDIVLLIFIIRMMRSLRTIVDANDDDGNLDDHDEKTKTITNKTIDNSNDKSIVKNNNNNNNNKNVEKMSIISV